MFAGPAGTGKTTCAIALARELFGDEWRGCLHELNSSDERGIDIVRGKIKEIAGLRPFGTNPFKIIFLDEADNLTADAQAALRRTMETFTRTTRFILSCNYSSRIIEPIQSRTAVFRFRPLPKEAVEVYVKRVAKAEKLDLTENGLEALVYLASGDLRRATNSLQVAAAVSSKIDADSLYKVASTARPEEVKRLLETALQGDFTKARDVLDEILIEYGLSGEDILRQIHRNVFDLSIPDDQKVRIVDHVGEAEFRLVEGSNERIQLESLLAHLALVGREMRKK
jgi:replication factor C small subunit